VAFAAHELEQTKWLFRNLKLVYISGASQVILSVNERKIVQTKYDVPVRKAHKGNHICLYDFSFSSLLSA